MRTDNGPPEGGSFKEKNHEEQVNFSNPAENGDTLKNAYGTYFVRRTK